MAVALEDVWPLWYEIGAGLKIPTSTLDQIQGSPVDQTIVRTYIVRTYFLFCSHWCQIREVDHKKS